MGYRQAADPGDPLRALDLRDVADGIEDRRLGQTVHHHVQQACEIRQRAAHAERKHDDAHVLDRGVGEQPFDVAPPVEHEGCEDQRDQAHRHHQRARRDRERIGREQDLEAQQRIERDVQEQARQHGRYRCRTLGVSVGQPGVQRREADLGSVTEKQEDESDIEQGSVKLRRMLDQQRPDHAILAFTHDRSRRHIDEDGAEQGERNSDAAQNEIFPRRLQRGVRAIDADHQHGRQGRDLDRNPHQADIVRHESQVHAEHHGLVHGVVETQVDRRQPAGFEFVGDIAGAEDAGREADKRIEHDEDDVEVVDQHVWPRLRSFDDEQRERRNEGQQARDDVQPRRQPVAGQRSEQGRRADRDQQHRRHGIEGSHAHLCSPR